jgi:hypothetical protein
MNRIEILYDFDFAAFNYYANGLNDHPGLRFSGNEEKFYPLAEIKKRKNIDCLNLLGCGLDKICIADSDSNKCFVLEPCSAMLFICKMEEVFEYFISKQQKGKTSIKNGGITLSESSFRVGGERGEDELLVGINFYRKNESWVMEVGKLGEGTVLEIPLTSFLSAYFEFGERMKRFYNGVLPEHKEFTYQYPLFLKAINESVVKTEFEVRIQSSYDEKTYYDYQ